MPLNNIIITLNVLQLFVFANVLKLLIFEKSITFILEA